MLGFRQLSERLNTYFKDCYNLLLVSLYNDILWKMQVLNSDSGDDSIPEDDPDSVVVEFIDFIKVEPFFSSSTLKDIEYEVHVDVEKSLLVVSL